MTNGTDSRIAVAGLSRPNSPISNAFLYSRMPTSSAKLPSALESRQTTPFWKPSQRNAKTSSQMPLRFRSPLTPGRFEHATSYSAAAEPLVRENLGSFSLKEPKRHVPFGAPVYDRPSIVNVPSVIVTVRSILIHDGSPSVTGSVNVTQFTIFRSPVEVVCNDGWPTSTPVSRWPMVMPRPSQVGCAATNCGAPVSRVGM